VSKQPLLTRVYLVLTVTNCSRVHLKIVDLCFASVDYNHYINVSSFRWPVSRCFSGFSWCSFWQFSCILAVWATRTQRAYLGVMVYFITSYF